MASAVFTVLAVCAVVVVLDAGVVVPVVVLFFLVVLVLVGVVVGVGLGVYGFYVSSPFPGSRLSGTFGVSVFTKIAYTSRSSLTSVSAVTVSPVPSAFVFHPLKV